MVRQPTEWDGPGESYMTALVRDGEVSIYLATEEDEYAIQGIPIAEFKVWASTVLAEIALAEKE